MIKAIVTDIEGTTSSLSFVKDVLFPYARERIEHFVREHADDQRVRSLLESARREANRPDLDLDETIAQLTRWIEEDRKVTPLKELQGLIWESGYRNGDFHGHIYRDAVDALKRWRERGIALYVYSSGSVYAQKLLFGHTDYGDLTPLFSGYFDTRIGAKTESESYRRILSDLGLTGDDVLFLSDVEKELDAARQAGMKTRQLVRDQELEQDTRYFQVRSFSDIDPTRI